MITLLVCISFMFSYICADAKISSIYQNEVSLCKDVREPTPVLICSGANPTPSPTTAPSMTNAECKANCDLGGLILGALCMFAGGTAGLLFQATMRQVGVSIAICAVTRVVGVYLCKTEYCDNYYPK